MKLTYKALIIFSFLILLIFMGGAFTYKLADSIAKINRKDVPRIQCLNKLENKIRESTYSINTYRITGLKQHKVYFEKRNAKINTLLKLYDSLSNNTQGEKFLNEFDSIYSQVNTAFSRTIQLTNQQEILKSDYFF